MAESKQEAIELYREPAEYFYNNSLKISPKFVSPPGYATEETKRLAVKSIMADAANRSHKETAKEKKEPIKDNMQAAMAQQAGFTMEQLVEQGYIVAGSPDEVADIIRRDMITLNAGNFMALPSYGNMDPELAKYNSEMYARYVKPQLDGLFADEWEHKWWPEKVGLRPPPQGAARPTVPNRVKEAA